MKQLIQKVENWFAERQIIENSTPLKQALKTSEEVLELQNAIIDDDLEEIKDAIGDIQVTLIGVCLHYGWDFGELIWDMCYLDVESNPPVSSFKLERCVSEMKDIIYNEIPFVGSIVSNLFWLKKIAVFYNLTLEECLQSAYDVISQRQGKMINGQFVKEKQLKTNKMKDKVNNPSHYGGKNNPYEAIKIIEAYDLNFSRGNVIKYTLRAGKKGNSKWDKLKRFFGLGKNKELEDLEKAKWYLDREIKNLKNKPQG